MTYRIMLRGQPADAVRSQITEIVGEEHMLMTCDHLEIVLPDQSALARVVGELTALGCRISSVDSGVE